jgi:hypothetical protein
MTYRYPGGLVRRTAANTSITGASGVWDLGSQAQAVRNNTWPISGLANPVSGSLRFRASASAWLNRTFGTPTLSTKWTYSGWFKLGPVTTTNKIIFDGGSPDTRLVLQDISNGPEQLLVGNDTTTFLATSALYRDYSAWYHAVLAFDSSQGTASNRLRLYINGSEVTAFATDNRSSISGAIGINTATAHGIGKQPAGGVAFFDGYMAEVNFIDGQQLTPSSFGQTSPITGVWEPIKYTGTYGNNGFYLSLSDTSSIGKDFSGNGNNWTPNNISTASGSTFDLMRDVPTQYTPQGVTDVGGVVRGNYGTLSPLWKGSLQTLSNGNLTSSKSSGTNISDVWGNFGMTSGKWYFECSVTALAATVYIGIGQGGGTGEPTDDLAVSPASYFYGSADGQKFYGNSGSAYGNGYVEGDLVACAIDMDNGKIWWAKNGIWQASGDPAAGTNAAFTDLLTRGSSAFLAFSSTNAASNSNTLNWNFGQRPFGNTPPTGFKSLCTTNLPTPTIGATAANAANKYFDATLITGTAATQVITNAGGFQPDFVWLKSRTNANNPTIYDAIRGVNTILYPALTNAEQVGTAQLTAFNSNGFTLGASENANDSNGEASVGWQWNAGGSTVTNTAGSISSQVRANPTAGFSIVTWTGTGTNRPSIGHGLGVAPAMIIEKGRDAGSGPFAWTVQHIGLSSWSNSLFLNNTSAENSGSGGGTAPSSTVYYAAVNNYAGENGVRYVAYCFAPIAGYSAFGSYTGNGSTDGPFVHTGFRPKFVMIKASSISGENWYIVDSSRSPYNAAILYLSPNNTGAEASPGAAQFFDFLSNGFKLRVSGSYSNSSGATYIYMAFAENPFKNSLAR